MNPAEWLHRTARRAPDAPALCRGTRPVANYAGFARRAVGIGAGLAGQGVAPGDRVALFMANRTEYLDALCLDRIARFKRPREYRFVDALAKNNYGKVLKTALRERLAAERQV